MRARVSSSVEQRGCSRVPTTSTSVLHRRPMRCWAGLVPNPSVGVLRQCNRAKNSDWPDSLHFCEEPFHCFNSVFYLSIRLLMLGERGFMLKHPSFRENRKFGRSELGAVVCHEHVRDAIPREYGFHFFHDIA